MLSNMSAYVACGSPVCCQDTVLVGAKKFCFSLFIFPSVSFFVFSVLFCLNFCRSLYFFFSIYLLVVCVMFYLFIFFLKKVVPVYCICLRNKEHPLERPLITSTHSAIATRTSHDNNDNLELLIWFPPHYSFVLHFSLLPGTRSTKKTSQPIDKQTGETNRTKKSFTLKRHSRCYI